jgi:hypothetical protein
MIGRRRLLWFTSGKANEALELGILSPAIFAKFIHYGVYVEFRNRGLSKRKSIQETAIETKCSHATVFRSIKFFEK